ncbi:ThuA domain-containing protein [Streptomyces sp. ME01-24h]|nr:ThuA domain-containing protein [Streptomyces sp. ME19-03-3]MDX3357097.1 ThuA domain-containing protein [Streptomyces sp. ME01-24h]
MPRRDPRVLVYTRTTAYRHDSIPDGVRTLRELGAGHGFLVDATERPEDFEGARLRPYDAVVFLSTSGEVLGEAGRAALEAHHADGAGFMGVHAAACTEYDWPYFGELLGARFTGHPPLQPGTVLVEDAAHPATAHLDAAWKVTDEWYDFDRSPRPGVRVLASADESSYTGGSMGGDHPLVWCHTYGGGPVFYTALGHCAQAYRDAAFRAHLLGGLRSVLPGVADRTGPAD